MPSLADILLIAILHVYKTFDKRPHGNHNLQFFALSHP